MKVPGNVPYGPDTNNLLKKISQLSEKLSSHPPKKGIKENSNITSAAEVLTTNSDDLTLKLEQTQNTLSLYQTIQNVIKENADNPEGLQKALENLQFNGQSALQQSGLSLDMPIEEISKKVSAQIKELKSQIGKLAVSLENIVASQSNVSLVSQLFSSEGLSSLGLENINSNTASSLLQPLE